MGCPFCLSPDDSDEHYAAHLDAWTEDLVLAGWDAAGRRKLTSLHRLYSNEGWGDVWRVAPVMACKLPWVEWGDLIAYLNKAIPRSAAGQD